MKRITGLAAPLLFCATAAAAQTDLITQGKEVFGRVCFDCHNATAPNPDMIAPPIFAAKNHYANFTTRDDFVLAVSAFLLDPQEATARMPGAISQFGLMPPPDITGAEALAVAEYLFATDFTLPDWYQEHYQAEHGTAPVAN